jgi:hypothetical protein
MGAISGGVAIALGLSPVVALTGAALAAVIRVLAGDSPAALTAAVFAPVLAVASFAQAGGEPARAALALAAAGWTVTELARAPGSLAASISPISPISPIRAVLPAAVAGILEPRFVALVAIAGARLVTTPGPRSRWGLGVLVAGVLAVVLAVLAGTVWPSLGAWWFGAAAHPVSVTALAGLAGATLGPLTAVAALGGIAVLARPRYGELGLIAALTGAILADLRAGAFGPTSIGLAALLAGLAIGRLAGMIRMPSGQAVAGATIGALVVMPPAWTAVVQRSPPAHIGQASR